MIRYLILLLVAAFGLSLQAEEKPVATSSKIKLTEADWSTIKQVVARNQGKVVVVDIWSTACLPCMREFPNLLKLQKKYGQKHILCVSLNVDYAGIKSKPPKYYRPKVEKFLKRHDGECRHYMCNVDSFELFDELRLNSIPAVYVFGKDGKLVKRFDDSLLSDGEEDAFTYADDINPFIADLLKK